MRMAVINAHAVGQVRAIFNEDTRRITRGESAQMLRHSPNVAQALRVGGG
jgi:hypothetical protein